MRCEDEKKLDEINKARKLIGLKPIKITVGKCMKCGKEMERYKNYRCNTCNKIIEIMNYYDEVFERQYIFRFKDTRYREEKKHYVIGGK